VKKSDINDTEGDEQNVEEPKRQQQQETDGIKEGVVKKSDINDTEGDEQNVEEPKRQQQQETDGVKEGVVKKSDINDTEGDEQKIEEPKQQQQQENGIKEEGMSENNYASLASGKGNENMNSNKSNSTGHDKQKVGDHQLQQKHKSEGLEEEVIEEHSKPSIVFNKREETHKISENHSKNNTAHIPHYRRRNSVDEASTTTHENREITTAAATLASMNTTRIKLEDDVFDPNNNTSVVGGIWNSLMGHVSQWF